MSSKNKKSNFSDIDINPVDTQIVWSGRYIWLFLILLVFFFILVGRLWYLQIIKGEDFRQKSENNKSRIIDYPPYRGLIFDRYDNLLIDNIPSFDLTVIQSEVKDVEHLILKVKEITGLDEDFLRKKYNALSPRLSYMPQVWVSNLTKPQMTAVETSRYFLEGTAIQASTTRNAINPLLAPHVIGFLGEISKSQLESEAYKENYRPGDLVGKAGIEQGMEHYLHGKRGYKIQEVDYKGRVIEDVTYVAPEPGLNIHLTLDMRLQAIAQELLGERAGAIVVLDPRNFEILALASSPIFSLEDFQGGISKEKWALLKNDKFNPMENRAIAGQYPPGSTFKIVTSLAALADKVITPETTFHCAGSLKLGNREFGCWNRRGHGSVNLVRSLKSSCDVYYYEVGRRLGVDKLAKRAREFFGLGSTYGIGLPTERGGLMPDQAWKMRRFKQKWAPGETLPVSIGQGYVLTTPLQVAVYTGVIANGGTLYKPILVKKMTDVDNNVVKVNEPEVLNEIKDIKKEYIEKVRQGLTAVVSEPGGTGTRGSIKGVKVAGKTGTSQVVSLKKYQSYARSAIPYKYRDHAWFTSYAPSENPEVVVTVLLEHTGGGGANAAPIASKMLEAYFNKNIQPGALPPPMVQPDKPKGWKSQL